MATQFRIDTLSKIREELEKQRYHLIEGIVPTRSVTGLMRPSLVGDIATRGNSME